MGAQMLLIGRLVFAMTTSRKAPRLMKRSHLPVLLSLIAAVAAENPYINLGRVAVFALGESLTPQPYGGVEQDGGACGPLC
jgi:hypothetical protein